MNIKYNQLCIRNAEKKDCEQLAVWWNDGTVMAHAGFPNGLGTSAAEIEKQIADDSDETRRRLIIEYNDVRIGEMSFYVFENHRYEIGIKICESDYQEKGIGRVVLSMLIEELFRMGANVFFLIPTSKTQEHSMSTKNSASAKPQSITIPGKISWGKWNLLSTMS